MLTAALLAVWVPSTSLEAGPREMTTEDRLAILYAPQFNFTRDGEPLVNVGVMNHVNKAEVSSNGPIRVLPLGDGGPELELDGRRFEVKISGGKAGKYKHWVVVERLAYGDVKAQDDGMERWVKRGYLPKVFEVGGLFAVGGNRFDGRTALLCVGGFEDQTEARLLADRLEARFGVETGTHTELLKFPSGHLQYTDKNSATTLKHRDVIWVGPTKEGQVFTLKTAKGDLTFAGGLIFTADHEGSLSVVNSVPAETLVKGVVPSEVYASAPMESLKAQAVAARGEVLSYLGVRHLGDPYFICNEVHCQSYKGVSRQNSRTDQAVEETRGQLMFVQEGRTARIVDARYSSNCGGHSEHKHHVWGGEPVSYLTGHGDSGKKLPKQFRNGVTDKNISAWLDEDFPAYCKTTEYGGSRNYRWTKSVGVNELEKYMNKHFDVGKITGVEILKRGVSGRVIKMRINGTRKSATLDRELSVRRAFGGLKSAMFSMEVKTDAKGRPSRFEFKGGGFGHGVGMCQTGAMMMAKEGKGFKRILNHYYPGSTIQKLY